MKTRNAIISALPFHIWVTWNNFHQYPNLQKGVRIVIAEVCQEDDHKCQVGPFEPVVGTEFTVIVGFVSGT